MAISSERRHATHHPAVPRPRTPAGFRRGSGARKGGQAAPQGPKVKCNGGTGGRGGSASNRRSGAVGAAARRWFPGQGADGLRRGARRQNPRPPLTEPTLRIQIIEDEASPLRQVTESSPSAQIVLPAIEHLPDAEALGFPSAETTSCKDDSTGLSRTGYGARCMCAPDNRRGIALSSRTGYSPLA